MPKSKRWAAVLMGVAACASGRAGEPVVVPAPWAAPSGGGGGVARWAYLPSKPTRLLGSSSLGGGRTLYFGERGERWVYDTATGDAEAAGELAEQDLVGLARDEGGGWVFVGGQGSMFVAREPLGPFVRVARPPRTARRASTDGRTVAVVSAAGELLRSTDGGRTFGTARLDAPFVGDVALLEGGAGLALAYPEALFVTRDAGANWAPLAAPTVGATRLEREGGVAWVEGIARALRWAPGGQVEVVTAARPAGLRVPGALAAAPTARAIAEGRGAFVGESVLVAVAPEQVGRPWRLGRARLGGRMAYDELAGTQGCQHLALDAVRGATFVACATNVGGASRAGVKVIRYADDLTPHEVVGALEGAGKELRVVVGEGPRVLLFGACRAGHKGPCDTEAPLRLTETPTAADPGAEGAATREVPTSWAPVAAPTLVGKPAAAAFGAGGEAAYIVGWRGKSNEPTLFVSHDGGAHFEARDLELARRSAGVAGVVDARRVRDATLSVADGALGLALSDGSSNGTWLAALDDDGRVLTYGRAPGGASVVGVSGRRALALDGAAAFETLDGGTRWAPLGEISALGCADKSATCPARPVACGQAGCVIGDEVARVGWGGRTTVTRDEPPAGPTDAPPLPPPAPLVCRLDKGTWATLPRGAHMPTAAGADRGKAAWAVLADEPARASASLVQSAFTSPGKFDETPLLTAATRPGDVAFAAVDDDPAGVAVVRVTLGAERAGELAWGNVFEGKTYRARLRDRVLLRAMTPHGRGAGLPAAADIGALSVGQGGVFFRGSPTFDTASFVDARGTVETRALAPAPADTLDGTRLGPTLVEGKPLDRHAGARTDRHSSFFLGVGDPTWALLRAGTGATWDALALQPPGGWPGRPAHDPTFGWAFLGATPMVYDYAPAAGGRAPRAYAFGVRAEGAVVGPPTALATQTAALAAPRPCAAADRAKSIRSVAPAEAATRRAVLVEAPDGSVVAALVTNAMVVYGPPDAPCLGTVEAYPVNDFGLALLVGQDVALVSFSDLEHAWLFRAGFGELPAVEARTMRCRGDANAHVPESALRALSLLTLPQTPVVRASSNVEP